MASTGLQFHATREEISNWVQIAVRKFELGIARIDYAPFRLELIPVDQFDINVLESSQNAKLEFALFKDSLNLHANTQIEFFDNNEGCILLSIGGLSTTCLNESFIGCKSRFEHHVKIAKMVMAVFKKNMRAGVIGRNMTTGESARYSSHWLSPKACELEKSGLSLLALGGVIRLSSPSTGQDTLH